MTRTVSSNFTTTACANNAPFDNTIYHHKKVFVVAEVDDTYVYHIHLGKLSEFIVNGYKADFFNVFPALKQKLCLGLCTTWNS